jgi:hypothetical protein
MQPIESSEPEVDVLHAEDERRVSTRGILFRTNGCREILKLSQAWNPAT